MKQLYLSANHISRRNIPAYMAALNRYRVTHMLAYSSAASALACEAPEFGLKATDLRLVITIAEPLTSWQRDTLRQGLASEIRESYGMAEMVAAATECPAGTLHLWPEVGWLEVVSDADDAPVPCGTAGRFIATGLLNADMPLIRYSVGDRGRLMASDEPCPCGRLLPALASVEGRVDDILYTRDGRWIGRLDPVFKAHLPIYEAQIIQETLDRVRIRYVPTQHFTPESSRSIIERLQARLGPVEVIMEEVNEVPRGVNGKFRAVICNLSAEQKKWLQGEVK
jgi:phenylacetate-CoA ligase